MDVDDYKIVNVYKPQVPTLTFTCYATKVCVSSASHALSETSTRQNGVTTLL